MATPAQKRAVQNYRASLAERELAQFEAVAREANRELVRRLGNKVKTDVPP